MPGNKRSDTSISSIDDCAVPLPVTWRTNRALSNSACMRAARPALRDVKWGSPLRIFASVIPDFEWALWSVTDDSKTMDLFRHAAQPQAKRKDPRPPEWWTRKAWERSLFGEVRPADFRRDRFEMAAIADENLVDESSQDEEPESQVTDNSEVPAGQNLPHAADESAIAKKYRALHESALRHFSATK